MLVVLYFQKKLLFYILFLILLFVTNLVIFYFQILQILYLILYGIPFNGRSVYFNLPLYLKKLHYTKNDANKAATMRLPGGSRVFFEVNIFILNLKINNCLKDIYN